MQIVRALTVRCADDADIPPDVASAVDLDTLLGRLAAESSPVRRNQLVREWLVAHRATVLEQWVVLGLPLPPAPEPEPELLAVGGGPLPRRDRGLAVFDFDLTLAAKNVGIFDLEECTSRCFGGAFNRRHGQALHLKTVLFYRDKSSSGDHSDCLFFETIRCEARRHAARHAATAGGGWRRDGRPDIQLKPHCAQGAWYLISNQTTISTASPRKVLKTAGWFTKASSRQAQQHESYCRYPICSNVSGPRPGCGLLPLLRGSKTNAETVIGCEDYTEAESRKQPGGGGGGGAMRVKSSAINRRWLATCAGLDPSRVIFVVRACSACQKPYAIIRVRSWGHLRRTNATDRKEILTPYTLAG